MKKFTMLMAAAAVALSASADMYVIGEVAGGWSANVGTLMEEVEPGVYQFAGEYSGKYFGFATQLGANAADWSTLNANRYGAKAGNGTPASVGTHEVAKGENAFIGQPGNLTYIFDSNKMILTVEGEIAESEVFLAGKFNDYAPGDSNYKFEKTGTNEFTLSLEKSFDSDFKVIADGAWLGTTTAVESGVSYTLSDIGMANSKFAKTPAVNPVFVFNTDTKTLVVTYSTEGGEDPEPPVVDYSSWYVNIVGDFNGWKDNGKAEGTGMTKHESLAIGTSPFKVKVWNGSDVLYSTGGAIPQNVWVKIDGNADANMTIEGAKEGEMFDVEWDCANTSIKVTPLGDPTGVAAVEAANGEAVYFNMQGVRVANPENGLFIRVQNGKAVKVVK